CSLSFFGSRAPAGWFATATGGRGIAVRAGTRPAPTELELGRPSLSHSAGGHKARPCGIWTSAARASHNPRAGTRPPPTDLELGRPSPSYSAGGHKARPYGIGTRPPEPLAIRGRAQDPPLRELD